MRPTQHLRPLPVLFTVAAVLALPAWSGCDGAPVDQATSPSTELPVLAANDDVDIGPVIAEVNGVRIGANEFSARALRARRSKQGELTLDDRREVLDDLINEKTLYLEARRQGLDQDPKVQAQMIQLLLRKSVYSEVRSNDFTEEDLRAFYEAHVDDFVVPEKVRTKRIFVKADPVRTDAEAKQLVEAALQRVLRDPESFSKVAEEVSEGPFRGRGGDVGLLSKTGRPGVPPEVVSAAFDLEPGAVSAPFQAGGGWNIVTVVFRRESVERTFEQMKGAVLRRVKSQRQKELYEATVERLREGATVDIDEDALANVELRQGPGPAPRGPGMLRPREGGGDVPALRKMGPGDGAPPAGSEGAPE